ncbi:alpha/beta fold hydrolase [Nocardioides abyssi]|uniref:Alpha/beta fold hydrolase n=1 Tax=Nocardioides abyssi TaxID=3058370 RepID=A0ABT8EPL8_9ACTN|nr:alpha/beta fold hydrolase [Nocardioides abyssi]MDN4159963.1 alpha/beta fold hydrolase [Nocardioides abyssi]
MDDDTFDAAGAAAATLSVPTADGRVLEVLTGGDADGFPLVLHGGTPTAAVRHAPLDRACADLGLRLVTMSRPGYGGSTPRPLSLDGPRVVDDVADTVAVLDALDVDEFLTIGWSGGGPRALACAALLPDRCRAAATLAGVAPHDADGLDWDAGMAPENVEEFAAAVQGRAAYEELLARTLPPIFAATADDVAAALGELVTPVDAAALDGAYAAWTAETFRRAGAQGVVGAVDDGLAIVAPWGFDLADVRVPVAVWQGRQDAMVPYEHGAWLAAHVPGAEAHLFEDEGHLTLLARVDTILADLKRLGGV